MNTELNQILQKLEQIETTQHKSWLSSLTEESAVMLTITDIAEMTGYGYDHVYKHIVARPDFPQPVGLGQPLKRPQKQNRRWLAGAVVRYFRNINQN